MKHPVEADLEADFAAVAAVAAVALAAAVDLVVAAAACPEAPR